MKNRAIDNILNNYSDCIEIINIGNFQIQTIDDWTVCARKETLSKVNFFVNQYRKADKLYDYGLKPYNKLVLFGDFLSDRDIAVEYIALSLGMPLCKLNIKKLIIDKGIADGLVEILVWMGQKYLVIFESNTEELCCLSCKYTAEIEKTIHSLNTNLTLGTSTCRYKEPICIMLTEYKECYKFAKRLGYFGVSFGVLNSKRAISLLLYKLRGIRKEEGFEEKVKEVFGNPLLWKPFYKTIIDIAQFAVKHMIVNDRSVLKAEDVQSAVNMLLIK